MMSDTRSRSAKPPKKIYHALRLVGWNMLWIVAGLILMGIVGEAWLRWRPQTVAWYVPYLFVPNVGLLLKPNAEVRWTTRGREFWTVSSSNSLGFLSHEPVRPEDAAASCHIAVIGDSFVEAREVAIADKFPAKLERLASRQLPHLDVTVSAFGMSGTGQINQLPFYDEYASYLHPKLLVLVFFINDFMNNSPTLNAMWHGWEPKRQPYVTAEKDGEIIKLRPPDPNYMVEKFKRIFGRSGLLAYELKRAIDNVRGISYFSDALYVAMRSAIQNMSAHSKKELMRDYVLRYPSDLWDEVPSDSFGFLMRPLQSPTDPEADLPLYLQRSDAVWLTGFALDQFKMRASRDGARIIILLTDDGSGGGERILDLASKMAEARGIPVINLHDYITHRGHRPRAAHWTRDKHWNPIGHQWAAEAVLEYLKRHPSVCNGLPRSKSSFKIVGASSVDEAPRSTLSNGPGRYPHKNSGPTP